MGVHRHPQARTTARYLVDIYDGSAEKLVESELEDKLDKGDIEEALRLDQVRREIERVYDREGK